VQSQRGRFGLSGNTSGKQLRDVSTIPCWYFFSHSNITKEIFILFLGKSNAKLWHSLNHIGTPYFTHWANGAPLTYSGFSDTYNLNTYADDKCAGFE
jgi:hypothetical protein